MAAISMIVAEIKLKAVYKCADCGKATAGSTVRCFFDGHNTDELKTFVDGIRPTSQHMPVGWSFNGRFSCGCKK